MRLEIQTVGIQCYINNCYLPPYYIYYTNYIYLLYSIYIYTIYTIHMYIYQWDLYAVHIQGYLLKMLWKLFRRSSIIPSWDSYIQSVCISVWTWDSVKDNCYMPVLVFVYCSITCFIVYCLTLWNGLLADK